MYINSHVKQFNTLIGPHSTLALAQCFFSQMRMQPAIWVALGERREMGGGGEWLHMSQVEPKLSDFSVN